MALIAEHLTKVTLDHATHSAAVAHVGKEGVRQQGQLGRHAILRSGKGSKTQTVRAAHGFNPKAAKVSSRSSARAGSRMTMSYAARGFGGHGGGFASGFASGGFHGK